MDNFFIGQTIQLDDAVYTIVSRQPNKVVTLENSKGERFSKTVDSLRKRVERGTTTPFSPKVNDTIYIECVGLCRIKSEIDNKKVLTTSYGVDFIISKGSFCNRKFVSLFEGKRMKTTDGVLFYIVKIYEKGVGSLDGVKTNVVKFQTGYFCEMGTKEIKQGFSYASIKERLTKTPIKYNIEDEYVGNDYTTKEGQKCTVVKKVGDYYEIKLDDGTTRLVADFFVKNCHITTSGMSNIIRIGDKYVSRDNEPYEVVALSDDQSKVTIKRLSDAKKKVVSALSLKRNNGKDIIFNRRTPVNKGDLYRKYKKDYKGVTLDGYEYKIKERNGNDIKIEFDDGVEMNVNYSSVKTGGIRRYREKGKLPDTFTISGEEWEVIGKNSESMYDRVRVRNKRGEETTIVPYYTNNELKRGTGDIIYMEGVGLSECLSDNGNWGKLMKRIEDDTVYEVTRGEFTNKKVTKKHMLELCNIKVGKYKVAEGYYPCICKTCQMKDILTYEEMLEHWRDCKE